MGTSDRRPYLSATTINQTLLDQCQDNLTARIEMIVDIVDIGTIPLTLHLSDRAKYVGATYYEARVKFPSIERTLGDWLSNELEFSTLEIVVNNADRKYNEYLPGSTKFNGFIGRQVEVKIGIAEISGSYLSIFKGRVTDVSGFKRDTATFTLICRSDFEQINRTIPDETLTTTDWPYLEDDKVGLSVPIIYGDWTTALRLEAPEVPAYVVNGMDPLVNASLDPPDPGVGSVAVRCAIASVPLKSVDTSSVVLHRGNIYYPIPSGDVSVVPLTDNQIIDIAQKGFLIEGNPWIFETGDEFWLKCKGVDLSGKDDNLVYQAYDIMTRFGGVSPFFLDSTWTTYGSKASPPENAISLIKSRVWQQEPRQVIEYVLSMLEQVRLEMFVNRAGFFSLTSLHLDAMQPNPSFQVKNWDIVKGSFKPQTDERNIFNRAKADFAYSATNSQNQYTTPMFRNQANITQMGREISKLITFPNLYIIDDVINQVKEILKLSAYVENIEIKLTSRSFLLDLGQEVSFDINIGSVVFQNQSEPVTGKIRMLRYEPEGMGISAKIWCFQMLPFPGSEKLLISGITGGSTATITQE